MARYWLGDLHLGHEKVAHIRFSHWAEPLGLDSNGIVLLHDSVILNELSLLTSNDEVWILGDISGGKTEDYALEKLSEIKADLHLISGNHDSCSSVHRNGHKHQKKFLKVFSSVQDFARVRLNGLSVLMSHYPYARSADGPDREGARYIEYRLPDTGMPLIHAHTHQTYQHMKRKRTAYDKPVTMNDIQQFCVSWDANRGMVDEETLNEWLKEFKNA